MYAAIPFPNLSPELWAFEVLGFNFALRWYALAYIAGLLIAWRMAVVAVRRPALWSEQGPPMKPAQVEDLLTWIILGVILGGRLGYVLFYQPAFYLQHPGEILRIWEGGMAFHGGLIGVIVAAWIYFVRHKMPILSSADLIAHTVPPGLLLGRLANFVNAELWGRQTDAPWGVVFPGSAAQTCQGVVEGLCARHPSQLYEAGLEGLLLGLLLLVLVYKRQGFGRPGLVTGVFFAGYGMARFVIEFFRQPDAQFVTDGNPLGLIWHLDGYGLSMGQILSVPMIGLGVWLIWRAKK